MLRSPRFLECLNRPALQLPVTKPGWVHKRRKSHVVLASLNPNDDAEINKNKQITGAPLPNIASRAIPTLVATGALAATVMVTRAVHPPAPAYASSGPAATVTTVRRSSGDWMSVGSYKVMQVGQHGMPSPGLLVCSMCMHMGALCMAEKPCSMLLG